MYLVDPNRTADPEQPPPQPIKLMIWDIYQQGKIQSAQDTAERAANKVDRSAEELTHLRRHVERLTLTCQALWELLRERNIATEAELEARILEIDLRDGKADGRIGTQIIACSSCGSNTNSRRQTCVMCGAPLTREHIFEG